MRFSFIVLCALFSTSVQGITYFEPNKGLPDYDKTTPFTNRDAVVSAELSKLIADISPADLAPLDKQCPAGSVVIKKAPLYEGDTSGKDWVQDLKTNICNSSKLSKLRSVIVRLAPTFHAENLTAWVADLEGNESKDLLIGYYDLSTDEPFRYPYLSMWRMKFKGNSYSAPYIGPFLAGELHSIEFFGQNSKSKTVFVQSLSCLECEPTVYLTPVDFDSGNDATPYEFTYSEKHDGFYPTIEYDLPGMGHTVDADVEVRVLPPSQNGPHLLEYYKIEADEGPSEWWEFTCKNYKCDYREYKAKAPDDFKKLWSVAKRL